MFRRCIIALCLLTAPLCHADAWLTGPARAAIVAEGAPCALSVAAAQSVEQMRLLGAIRAAPGDPRLRLAYATWLETQGESGVADFIRAQLATDAELEAMAGNIDLLLMGGPTLVEDFRRILVSYRGMRFHIQTGGVFSTPAQHRLLNLRARIVHDTSALQGGDPATLSWLQMLLHWTYQVEASIRFEHDQFRLVFSRLLPADILPDSAEIVLVRGFIERVTLPARWVSRAKILRLFARIPTLQFVRVRPTSTDRGYQSPQVVGQGEERYALLRTGFALSTPTIDSGTNEPWWTAIRNGNGSLTVRLVGIDPYSLPHRRAPVRGAILGAFNPTGGLVEIYRVDAEGSVTIPATDCRAGFRLRLIGG